MVLETGKKVYFLSDFHLGAPNDTESRKREDRLVRFLQDARKDAGIIFIVGDIFDFWFEYKTVVPKGFVRLLGCLAQISDAGIPLHIFTGNHDLWMQDYFQKELGIKLHANEYCFEKKGKSFYVAHGDGLGPGDYKYKFLKRVFRNPLCQWAFARIHPNLGLSIANYFSTSSRKSGMSKDMIYNGKEQEWLYHFAKTHQETHPVDFYLFGHRHLPLEIAVGKATYINTGEWLYAQTFARFDGETLKLLQWKDGQIETYDAKRPN